jgi:ribose transport system permease protein
MSEPPGPATADPRGRRQQGSGPARRPSVGTGWELTAIAAAVVGGVSLSGGEGRIAGIAAGAILLEFITNGLLALKVSPYDQQVVQGAVPGVAILLDRARARYFGRSRS